MYQTFDPNVNAVSAEVAYRRARLITARTAPPALRPRWWRRHGVHTN